MELVVRTIPTELAVIFTGMTADTIRSLAYRGKLTRYGTDRRAEWDLNELAKVAAARVCQ